MSQMSIKLKRVYEAPRPDDGQRYLVERLWPRGLKKDEAQLTGWYRDLAPSHELRRWFGHDPQRWEEFQRRYRDELAASDKQLQLHELAEKVRSEVVTLVFAARDEVHNNAVVLEDVLEREYRHAGTSTA